MIRSELGTISQVLVDRLCCDDDGLAGFCSRLLKLLAEGRPVSRAHLAAAIGWSRDEVNAALTQLPNLEFDGQGNIIGSGISLVPTAHRFQINGRALHTWCALDTLLYPIELGQTAQVASRCPVTGRMVRLTVTPELVADLDPSDAQVCVVVPEVQAARRDGRGVFCRHVHFLHGPAVGAAWCAAHPGTTLLSVDEAFRLARRLAECRYRLNALQPFPRNEACLTCTEESPSDSGSRPD